MTFPQHPFGLSLQLPHPLPGDTQLLAELGEGRGLLFLTETVAPEKHVLLSLGQTLDCLRETGGLQLAQHLIRRVRSPLVLYERPDLRRAFLAASGLVETCGIGESVLDLAHPLRS